MIYNITKWKYNPTISYYIKPLLDKKKLNSFIFLIRYVDFKYVINSKENSFIYFMDDDLWDLKALRYVPLRYAWKIFSKAYIYKPWIVRNAKILVSNEYLAQKYKEYNPQVIYPYPIYIDTRRLKHNPVEGSPVVFFHATASHVDEFIFINKLAKKLEEENIVFEVIVDRKIARRFRGIKNVVLINPMRWDTYLRFSVLGYRHVGLAPLFDNLFNRGRSYVKFFNIVRSGAVGIYSEHFPIADLIKEYKAGEVVPMDLELWSEKVKELVNDREKREEMYRASLELTEYLRERALESYSKIVL